MRKLFAPASLTVFAGMLIASPASASQINLTLEAQVVSGNGGDVFGTEFLPAFHPTMVFQFVFDTQSGFGIFSVSPHEVSLFGSGPDTGFDDSPGMGTISYNGVTKTFNGSFESQLDYITEPDGHEYISVFLEDNSPSCSTPAADGLVCYLRQLSFRVQRPGPAPGGRPDLLEPLDFVSSDSSNIGSFFFEESYVTGPTHFEFNGELSPIHMKLTATITEPAAVEEPSTTLLYAAGLIGLLAFRATASVDGRPSRPPLSAAN